MISHKYKCIFIHIPKTAGSSIEVALDREEKTNKGDIDEATGEHIMVTTGKEKHLNVKECRTFYGHRIWQEYFKFTVVRNPWDRIHSWWWNRKEIAKVISLSFAEYIHGICNPPLIVKLKPIFIDDPWDIPQIDWITSSNGKIEVDFICRFENIENDWYNLCKKINVPIERLPQILVKNRKPKERKHYTEYYNNRLIELVAKKYEKDILLFN